MNLPFSPNRFRKPLLTPYTALEAATIEQQVLDLSIELMQRPSITPEDKGCQVYIRKILTELGFSIGDVSRNGVTNTWACRGDSKGPCLVLAGHTDVVTPGPLERWHSDPFEPQIRDGILYGRGAADMKTGLAALLVAAQRFIERFPSHAGQLAFAITSDEEGHAVDGTWAITDWLKAQNWVPDFCLVGEPSSKEKVGDSIRVGRRGSLTANVKVGG